MTSLTKIVLGILAVVFTLSGCDKMNPESIPYNLILSDDNYSLDEGQSIEIDFLANDVLQGDNLAVTVNEESLNGTLTNIEGTTKYLYSTSLGSFGEDAFSYEVCGDGNCKTAVVSFQIRKITIPDSCKSFALTDNYETKTDEISIAVSEIIKNDVSPCYAWDINTFQVVNEPEFGKISLSNGVLSYHAFTDWVKDELRYEICNEAGECKKASIKIKNGNVDIPTQL